MLVCDGKENLLAYPFRLELLNESWNKRVFKTNNQKDEILGISDVLIDKVGRRPPQYFVLVIGVNKRNKNNIF